MHFKVIFNPFNKESQDVIEAAGNTELCEPLDFEPKQNAEHVSRVGTSASSTARAVTSFEMIRQRSRSTSSQFLTSFRFPIEEFRNERSDKFCWTCVRRLARRFIMRHT